RTTRGNTPVIYPPGEAFPVGGSKVLRSGDADRVTVVAAGGTVHEALAAADAPAADALAVPGIGLYSVKPGAAQTLRAPAGATGSFVTVEDHWPEGGIGDAVLAAFAMATSHRGSPSSPCTPCPARPRRPSSCTRPGSMPRRSRPRSARWWTPAGPPPGSRRAA